MMDQIRGNLAGTMQIHFRQTEQQARTAYTSGLYALGQQEIAVSILWPEHDPRDRLIVDLFRFLETYLSSQPRRIQSGETLRYGWLLLRFVQEKAQFPGTDSNILMIEERQDPSQNDAPFVPGVARTLELLQLQHDALRRNRVTGDVIYPSPTQIALICTNITPETVQQLLPFMAHRAWQPNTSDSGWFFGCCGRKHDHDDPAELTRVHLTHLVERFAGLFPYLAFPVGYQLLFEQNNVIIFHPGEEHGRIDPENTLTLLP